MPQSVDLQEFERTASRTGIFKGVEIDLLHETLLSWLTSPGEPYTVLELRDGKTLAAFAIIAHVSGRESTYDIRYLVLDRDYRSPQVGAKMLALIDEDLLKKNLYAVIRHETATTKIGNAGPATWETGGYKIIGHIRGYYGEEDDYYYLMKTVYRNPPEFSSAPSSEEEKPETT